MFSCHSLDTGQWCQVSSQTISVFTKRKRTQWLNAMQAPRECQNHSFCRRWALWFALYKVLLHYPGIPWWSENALASLENVIVPLKIKCACLQPHCQLKIIYFAKTTNICERSMLIFFLDFFPNTWCGKSFLFWMMMMMMNSSFLRTMKTAFIFSSCSIPFHCSLVTCLQKAKVSAICSLLIAHSLNDSQETMFAK